MSRAPLLIELLCEELPPKALLRLSEALTEHLRAALAAAGFLDESAGAPTTFATPRRLGVRFPLVRAQQEDRETVRKGPSIQAGTDAQGQPTKALLEYAAGGVA